MSERVEVFDAVTSNQTLRSNRMLRLPRAGLVFIADAQASTRPGCGLHFIQAGKQPNPSCTALSCAGTTTTVGSC
jgi:hypothetical protein